ncbi:hypothetical protein K2X30_04035 [bacterium]|nr:hypothetical protein [bacterium]
MHRGLLAPARVASGGVSICEGANIAFLPTAHPWLALGGIALRSLLLLTAHLGLPADSGIKPSSRFQLT